MKKLIIAALFIAFQSAVNFGYADNVLCREGDNNCTFVLLANSNNQLSVVNQDRAEQAMSPFSTFKIVNSIIGLETGLIKDAKQKLAYDKSH